ncbi:uncharacterized protein LOC131658506 [Vicia villosa]|uniref:uncharacterized protein LOC131658506 n=1 Tax=Vicia villosa TaxID=3911 RepID=UPI00273C6E9E|nr:uncharacterized protein LOC131658506 [Vicia villosa]
MRDFPSGLIASSREVTTFFFWHSCWLGDQTLSTPAFPYLFDLSTNKFCAVSDVVSWNNGTFSWNIEAIVDIERMLPPGTLGGDSAGASQLRDLKVLLNGIEPDNTDVVDFHWNLTSNGCFSVSSVSMAVSNAKDLTWTTSTIKLLELVWKIKIFSWRFFINRLPLKDLLAHRGMSNFSSLDCVFCSNHSETLEHLFYHCLVLKAVWDRIYLWLGTELEFSLDEFKNFGSIQEKVKNIKNRAKINLIWLALIWSIWNTRNNINFENASFSYEVIIYNIMLYSWRWLCNSDSKSRLIFYDWYKLPLNSSNSF